MKRHAKVSSAASSMHTARGLIVLIVAFAAFLGSSAPAALGAPPTLTVNPVTQHGITTAHLSGEVSVPADGFETYWCLEYAEEGTLNWSGFCFQGPVQPGESVPVEADIAGLKASTPYEARLSALNTTEWIEEHSATIETFETDPAPVAPTASVDPATDVSILSAKISGAVNPEGGNEETGGAYVAIHWSLQLSPTGEPGTFNEVTSGDLTGADAESEAAIDLPAEPAQLSGLESNHTYTYQLVATYAGQSVESATETFTTDPASNSPIVSVGPAGSITRTKAHISGSVNPNGGNVDTQSGPLPINWQLQYTKVSEPEAWQATASGTIEGEDAESTNPIDVQADVAGLNANTKYLYRVLASYGGQQKASSNGGFETLSSEGPTVVTGDATHAGLDRAYMRASVNPNEESTSFWFKYGTEDCFESSCAVVPAEIKRDAGSGTTSIEVTQAVGGLKAGTTYHYRVLAENPSGFAEGADRTFTTAPEPAPQSCGNEAAREELHATALPDCRTWELVSPPEKFGANVVPNAGRTRAAADESPGTPMAASFSALAGFADTMGSGGETSEYIAQRTLEPGTSGWSTHAINPPQESLNFFSSGSGFEGRYEAMSEDLSRGIFRAFSPVPTADDPHENVSGVANLYGRDDLRTAGDGTYRLFSDSVNPLGDFPFNLLGGGNNVDKPRLAAASADFQQAAFQSKFPLTDDAGTDEKNLKAFKSAAGEVRLVTSGSEACPGGVAPTFPCSVPGRGLVNSSQSQLNATSRELSANGSRLEFSSPITSTMASLSLPSNSETPGITSKLFQLDDQGNQDPADDAVIQLNASEKSSPDIARLAVYLTASTDGDRVFFASQEQLTDAPVGNTMGNQGVGLYLWDRKEADETQRVSVDAEGGTFTLTARSQPTVGIGNLSESSTTVTSVKGSFSVGQTIEGTGIQPGTTVTALGTFKNASNLKLTLSQPAELTASEVDLKASMQATTPPLPYNATPTEVQSALENLHFSAAFPELPLLGENNIEVTGGPGGPGAETPYQVTFTGALEGVNMTQMSTDGSGLTGGAATASVSTTVPVQNLTLLGPIATRGSFPGFASIGMLGASTDGHRAYFVTTHAGRTGIFYWQDLGGAPSGALSFVAPIEDTELERQQVNGVGGFGAQQRVSPDGKHLLFGSGLLDPIGYEPGSCGTSSIGSNKFGYCSEAYLYSAQGSTPTEPNLVCVSCTLAAPGLPFFGGPGDFQTSILDDSLRSISGFTRYISETRNIAAGGRYVFFTTDRALDSNDTNGVADAYEYDTQSDSVRSLSSGTDPANSYFMDASRDGNDAFIVTRERLSGWDVDNAYDLYDVRVGGGVPEPAVQVAECEGESCKGAAPQAPPARSSGSTSLTSTGNLRRPRCPKGRRAIRRGGKTRCVKKHHRKHHKRAANNDRRAGR